MTPSPNPEHPLIPVFREWEELFEKLYSRKPAMIEREQFILGLLYGQMAEAKRVAK